MRSSITAKAQHAAKKVSVARGFSIFGEMKHLIPPKELKIDHDSFDSLGQVRR